jgi:hypothetical protein
LLFPIYTSSIAGGKPDKPFRHLLPMASYTPLEDPDIIARPPAAEMWFRSCAQTYLERDVRTISSIRDLATFRRFLALVTLPNQRPLLLEAKATTTPRPEMAASVARLAKNITGYRVSGALVHPAGSRKPTFDALSPGVKALPLDRLHEVLT